MLATVKSDSELKKLPVIVFTQIDDHDTIRLCQNLGCNLYIVKPLADKQFQDVIKKLAIFLAAVEIPTLTPLPVEVS